ncbi:CCR4-NOT transcription complex subunit 1-like isoform X1 [Mytilus galloprovincialis]|uniref:CCR4-NOT transcription complex subunit 1-like isoform X1 n=1 Tax=Mytilus galloprovincialis TaxID=29158 RepID=UPI003F7C425E
MNLDSLSFALAEISYSVANLTKKNFKSSITEISHLVNQHGAEADRHLFRCLFSHVDFSGDGRSSGKDFHQTQYLIQECCSLLSKPNFVSILCYSVDNPLHHQKNLKPSPHLLPQISKVIKLNRVQEVTFGIALLHSSNSETRQYASQFVRQKLPDLIRSYVDSESSLRQEGGLQDVAIEVLHLLVVHLIRNKDNFGIGNDQKEVFLSTLRKDFPHERVPVILGPLLYPESEDLAVDKLTDISNMPKSVVCKSNMPNSVFDSSLDYMILERGYSCTQSPEECRQMLMQFGVREITPASVAKVLGMMARTPTGLNVDQVASDWDMSDKTEKPGVNTWNVDVFIGVVQELVCTSWNNRQAPHFNWRDVVIELDHPNFMVLNKKGLRLLVQGLIKGLQEVFPIDYIYRPWKNTEGQLSLIVQALRNPDVFCFADYPCHTVVTDILKAAPDDDNRDITTWRSLDMVETLLRLSEAGHYQQISELFKFPIQNCPDMLVLALLQITPTWNTLKQELISTLMPIFLGNHPNSAVVLHYAWHCQGHSNTIRTLIMHSMAEWYMRGEQHDQNRLSRILDCAQDLKALSMLLNATPFAFVIDLACLASRREYLKLDKWLSDKIREHGEPFIQTSVNFLKRRCPQLMGGPPKDDQQQIKSQMLPPDTIGTMLACLQQCASQVSQELSEAILTMVANANILMNKTRPVGPAGMGPKPTIPNIGPTLGNPLDSLENSNPLGIPKSWGMSGGGFPQTLPTSGTGFPPSLSSSGTGFPPSLSTSGTGFPPSLSTSGAGFQQPLSSSGAGFPQSLSSSNSGFPQSLSTSGSGFPQSLSTSGSGFPQSLSTSGSGFPQSLSSSNSGFPQSLTSSNSGFPQSLSSNSSGFPQSLSTSGSGFPQSLSTSGSGFPQSLSTSGTGFPQPLSSSSGAGFPQSLASLTTSTTPGSPAKGFPPTSASFGAIQSLTSQLQNISMGNNPIGAPRSSVNSLGAIMAGAGIKPTQPQQPQTPQPTQLPGQQPQQPPIRPAPSGDMTNIFADISQQFSTEVEDEANSYFQRIYNQPPHPTMSIDEVLDMLKRFKDSPNRREKDVYECMLRNLFEEYRFFPQYPERELLTTAYLFGGIIEKGLATYMALGIALRYVLEALKKPHNTKMYIFGIAALDRFKTRLKDYPQYCQHLAAIPHFSQFPPHLIEFVEFGARSQEPPPHTTSSRSLTPTVPGISNALTAGLTNNLGITSGTVTPTTTLESMVATTTTLTTSVTTTATTTTSVKPAAALPKPSIASATNIDTLLAGQLKENIPPPPESVQDKIFFIFNNLSLANMNQKGEELKKEVSEDYMPWVGQYLVMKRASIEPNFHTLYAAFVDVLGTGEFQQQVIRETFRNIKVLLCSDKGDANFSDRTLLKNLGHWIGMLTLAKNKPILQLEIDIKSLLYEAYHKGARELLYVVPFSAKIIESCAKSKVFKPPNPWTMGIMNVLAELHMEPDLKLNLKFEIEVLCKTLSIDLSDCRPTMFLKDVSRISDIEPQLSPGSKLPHPLPDLTPQPGDQAAMMTAGTPTVPTTARGTTPTTTPNLPPRPQFSYDDVNTANMATIGNLCTINDQIALFQANPQLKQLVKIAVEKSLQELLPPVVDRTIKISLVTCEQIIKKDFALDPDESRMRAAAHHMVRHMISGLALITSREPVLVNISNNLKSAFLSTLRIDANFQGATPQQKEMIEQAAQQVAQDNTELACVFIQKTAIEKAIPDIDKRLATEFELRKHARTEGRRYCDPVVLTYQAERMPEQIRLKVGGATPSQLSVYEEFARNIPGFLPAGDPSFPPGAVPAKPQPTYSDESFQLFERIIREIEQHVQQLQIMFPASNPQINQLHSLLEALTMLRNSREQVTVVNLIQKAVEGLLEHLQGLSADQELTLRFKECNLTVLRALQEMRAFGFGGSWTNKQVTRCMIEANEQHKYTIEAVDCLIRSQLVNMPQYDMYLAQLMENGMNYMAVTLAMQVVQRFCVDDKASATESDFTNTIEALTTISTRTRQSPEGLSNLLENLRPNTDFGLERALGGPTTMMQTGILQAREIDDPPGLHDKAELLLRDWVNMYHSPQAGRDSTKAFTAFVQSMHQQGILKTDDLITRFFRLCTEMCVDLCYRALIDQTQNPAIVRTKCFYTLDAFVRLIALLIKHSGDTTNTITKINLLNKVLGIVAGVLLQDHAVRNTEFQQLPYHRIFIMLFIELNAPDHVLENINYQVLTAFCNTFHVLRPAKAPGFAYAWLELISHRVFIGRMLALTPQQKGWGMYAQLLIDLFKFLSPFLRNAELTKPTQMLYKGTLRVLLVLLHDFPEFLCDYHYAFCDVIPPNCIQMRNLILSAFPRNMRLPDPFTPNLKVDMLADIAHAPRILTNFANMIQPPQFKKDLDSYLKTRSPVTFLSDLRSYLQVKNSNEPGMRYNIPLMNALVLYVGTQAIAFINSKGQTPSMSTIAHSAHMDIFQNLGVDLDTEGRYLFLTAIANQLRYPNSHTHYFSCTLLYLFVEANIEAIQEQITRVLLERLIVNRPHPWGLLITFIELIKNPQFKFWNHEFVHCAPEIEKLFESVARSCMQPKSGGTGNTQNLRETDTTELH